MAECQKHHTVQPDVVQVAGHMPSVSNKPRPEAFSISLAFHEVEQPLFCLFQSELKFRATRLQSF